MKLSPAATVSMAVTLKAGMMASTPGPATARPLRAELDDGGGNAAGAQFPRGPETILGRLRLPAEDEAGLRFVGGDDVHRLQHIG